jgi:serine protease Do
MKIDKKYIREGLFCVGGIILGVLISFVLMKYTSLGESLQLVKTVTKNGTTVIEKTSLSNAVEKSKDSVFLIRSYKNDEEISTGTGFAYKTDNKYGYIMTNQHVISDADNIVLVDSEDQEFNGKVLGSDEYLDLAIIQVDKSKIKSVAIIGTSQNSNVGDTVFTIGSPLGYTYRGTVTSGILSGKDRMVPVSINNSNKKEYVMKVLQTDAAINPGNSGGPLLNVNGEVIGVNTMKLVEDQIESVAFAIPIEFAMKHVKTLEEGKKIEWPTIGISMVDVSERSVLYAKDISIPNNLKVGVAITEVYKDSNAINAGLKKGDVIVGVNEEIVKNIAYLRYELFKYKPGDTIQLTIFRDNKQYKVSVKLSK